MAAEVTATRPDRTAMKEVARMLTMGAARRISKKYELQRSKVERQE